MVDAHRTEIITPVYSLWMTSAPKVAVIILSWNRCAEVLHTLALLARDDYPGLEVIVVDNASRDQTVEAVQRRFPRVRIFRLPENFGVIGWDFGIHNTDADYVVTLDDDSAPDPGAIARMVRLFEANPGAGIVPFHIQTGPYTNSNWAGIAPEELIGFISCGAGFRRRALLEAGPYDRDLIVYANEWDLAIRILDRGYAIAFDPAVGATHRASPLNRSTRRLRSLSTRNELWMVLKYFPLSRIPVLTTRVLFWNAATAGREGVASLGYTLEGALAAVWTSGRAWRKRRRIRPEVVRRYERNFWTFQPIWKALLRRATGRSGPSRRRQPIPTKRAEGSEGCGEDATLQIRDPSISKAP